MRDVCRVLPRSARWLLANQRTEEAGLLIRRAARLNRQPLQEDLLTQQVPRSPILELLIPHRSPILELLIPPLTKTRVIDPRRSPILELLIPPLTNTRVIDPHATHQY